MVKSSTTNFAQNLILFFITISILLLTVNFRTGYGDGGLNIYAAILRSQVWFTLAIATTCLLQPNLLLLDLKKISFDFKFLLISPFIFFTFSIISTFTAMLIYQKSIGFLGFTEGIEVITAGIIGIIIFNLINENLKAVNWIVFAIVAMPALNIIAVFTLSNSDIEFLGGNSGYTLVWYLGYGNRFIGLASNSNAIATQVCVSLGFIIAILGNKDLNFAKISSILLKLFLTLYALALIVMLLLTAVRAGILSVLVMYLVSVFVVQSKIIFKLISSFFIFFLLVLTFILIGGDVFTVLESRLTNSGDGRFAIWRYYLDLLSSNIMGFGYAFEEIVNTSEVNTFELNRQRLTPHNAFINAWVFGGIIGFIFTCFYVVTILQKIINTFLTPNIIISSYLKGACLSWIGLISILFFGGQIFGDWNSTILLSIVISGIYKIKKFNYEK